MKNEVLQVRVSGDEYAVLSTTAKAVDVTLSELVRIILKEGCGRLQRGGTIEVTKFVKLPKKKPKKKKKRRL